jgi:hypothetical protein
MELRSDEYCATILKAINIPHIEDKDKIIVNDLVTLSKYVDVTKDEENNNVLETKYLFDEHIKEDLVYSLIDISDYKSIMSEMEIFSFITDYSNKVFSVLKSKIDISAINERDLKIFIKINILALRNARVNNLDFLKHIFKISPLFFKMTNFNFKTTVIGDFGILRCYDIYNNSNTSAVVAFDKEKVVLDNLQFRKENMAIINYISIVNELFRLLRYPEIYISSM